MMKMKMKMKSTTMKTKRTRKASAMRHTTTDNGVQEIIRLGEQLKLALCLVHGVQLLPGLQQRLQVLLPMRYTLWV